MFTELLAMNSGSGGGTPTYEEVPLTNGSITYKIKNGEWRVTNDQSSGSCASCGYIIDGVNTVTYVHPTYATVNYDSSTNELSLYANPSIYSGLLCIFKVD